jgi:hypothetical protein
MRAIIINRPGSPAPAVIDIDGADYTAIQKVVGGPFDVVHIGETETAYVHDEGLFQEGYTPIDITFPDCRQVRLAGPVVVLGTTWDGDTAPSAMDEAAIKWSVPEATFEGMETKTGEVNGWFTISNEARWSDGR